MDITYSSQLWELTTEQQEWWTAYCKEKPEVSVALPKNNYLTVISATTQEALNAALDAFDDKFPSQYAGMGKLKGGLEKERGDALFLSYVVACRLHAHHG